MNRHFPLLPAVSCIAVAAACSMISCKKTAQPRDAGGTLPAMREVAQRFIEYQSNRLMEQLTAFSKIVAADRDFSMKLLVDNNRFAPEVTDFTQRYMEPMGFSLLDITDAQHVLLSCGQFPASAGTSLAKKAAGLSDRAQFVDDMVKGQATLTMQTQLRFKIIDSVLFCSGGLLVDDRFVAALPLANGFKAIIRQGAGAIGVGPNTSISAGTDSTLTINDTTYHAATIALPYSGPGEVPVLIIVDQRPARQK